MAFMMNVSDVGITGATTAAGVNSSIAGQLGDSFGDLSTNSNLRNEAEISSAVKNMNGGGMDLASSSVGEVSSQHTASAKSTDSSRGV